MGMFKLPDWAHPDFASALIKPRGLVDLDPDGILPMPSISYDGNGFKRDAIENTSQKTVALRNVGSLFSANSQDRINFSIEEAKQHKVQTVTQAITFSLPAGIANGYFYNSQLRLVIASGVEGIPSGNIGAAYYDGIFQRAVLAGAAGEHFSHVERLRQEAFDLACPGYSLLVIIRQLVHTQNRNDVLQLFVPLQDSLYTTGRVVMLITNDQRIKLTAGGVERVNRRVNTQ